MEGAESEPRQPFVGAGHVEYSDPSEIEHLLEKIHPGHWLFTRAEEALPLLIRRGPPKKYH